MPTHSFLRYDLRTTEFDAAKHFYASVLGLELEDGPATLTSSKKIGPLTIWPLHEQARARGVPAHWLGSLGVSDVDAVVRGMLDAGAEQLGPVLRGPDGSPFAVLRDPFGAILGLRVGEGPAPACAVVWRHLNTRDVDGAASFYAERFGWSFTRNVEAPGLEGGQRLFAWEPTSVEVGSMANTARWPGVHVHWLYYFRVPDLDAATAKVREAGGTAVAPVVLPNGHRVAACEDPQRAAFGLLQASE